MFSSFANSADSVGSDRPTVRNDDGRGDQGV
jgi:hypothetical protein